jgi:general secretion pathway protein G
MRRAPRAFTFLELTIVVLILGILSALLIPRFTDASERTRDTAARASLTYLRGQIDLFKSQHEEYPPQTGDMWTLLQKTSNVHETATVSPVGTTFGPYIRNDPSNPWNNLTAVSSQLVDVDAGWYYIAGARNYELRLRNVDGTINYEY